MIVLKLFPAFMLFLLVAGHSLLAPSPVSAGLPIWCCPCGTECSVLNLGSWFCACRGTRPDCPYCQKNDPPMFQTQSFTENEMSEMESVRTSGSHSATKSDLTASMMSQMRGGKCASNRFSLRLLASAVDGFKFEPASFNENSIRDQTMAFHTAAEK